MYKRQVYISSPQSGYTGVKTRQIVAYGDDAIVVSRHETSLGLRDVYKRQLFKSCILVQTCVGLFVSFLESGSVILSFPLFSNSIQA